MENNEVIKTFIDGIINDNKENKIDCKTKLYKIKEQFKCITNAGSENMFNHTDENGLDTTLYYSILADFILYCREISKYIDDKIKEL